MPEHSDYTPAPWSAGDSFKSARAAYDVHAGRSYDEAVSKKVKASDLVPAAMTSKAAAPILIFSDETGSMGEWPATIFSKLGYLDHEAKFYFDDDYDIGFGAFGDATNDEKYPVQIRPFAKEGALQDRLKELVIEGQGGSGACESAELCALYADRNVDVSSALRPILIIITDEKCYETINPETARAWCRVELQKRITTKELFESLKTKWSVYVIRKPYGRSRSNEEDSLNREIRLFWENLVGADHVAFLPEAGRVVDVIFGIFAQETGKVDAFREELKERQLKELDGEHKVDVVLKALTTIHRLHDETSKKRLPGPADGTTDKGTDSRSVTKREPGTTTRRSKSLLDE